VPLAERVLSELRQEACFAK